MKNDDVKAFKSFPFVILIFLALVFSSCDKSSCEGMQKATIIDYSGFDGCNYVIRLKDGTLAMPYNLNDFDIALEENKKIWIKYKVKDMTGMIWLCHCGDVIEIEEIRER